MRRLLYNGKKVITVFFLFAFVFFSLFTANAATPPDTTEENPTQSTIATEPVPNYKGLFVISKDTENSSQNYTSISESENALLISGGTSTITNATVNKTGDCDDKNADFFGTNSAVLTYNGAILNLNDGSVSTNGKYANAVFAYKNGTVNLSDTTIGTSGDYSGGVMVADGGAMSVKNATVSTTGNSSAAIKGGKGGGMLTVNGGTYSTSGTNSPAIYSTANISVNNAILTSTASEGAVVDGANSITLDNVTLNDTNSNLSENSETYKNIFLYKSESDVLNTEASKFTAKDSKITTNKGDTFFVTNTAAEINLTNNTIVNTSGDFLRIQKGKWGEDGSNGGRVTLNMSNQNVKGNVIVDDVSTLVFNLDNESVFQGAIDYADSAKKVSLKLSKDSVVSLTSDSHIDFLENEDSTNTNIYLNGHKLFVNGLEVSGNNTPYNSENTETTVEQQTQVSEIVTESVTSADKDNNGVDNNLLTIIIIVSTAVLIAILIIVIVSVKKSHAKEKSSESDGSAPNNEKEN